MWWAVIVAALGCYALKLIGLSIPERVLDRPAVRSIAALLPVALLAALVSTGTPAEGTSLTVDARLAGLGVAVIALLLRAPFLVVVVAAAAGAAVVRALG